MNNNILKAGITEVALDRDAGELSLVFSKQKKLRLRAGDSFDGVRWFSSAENWNCFEENGLVCARFSVFSGNDNGECAADYTFCINEKTQAVLIITRLRPGSTGKPELPFDWLRFETQGVHTVHTSAPTWSGSAAQMKIPTSFRKNMILESEEGCVGFFHGGEPVFDPKTQTARPDMWLETCGLTGYQPVHTAVLVYGEDASRIAVMERAANELFLQAQELCGREKGAFPGKEHCFQSGELIFSITENEGGAALTMTRTIGREAKFSLPLIELRLRNLYTQEEFTVNSREGWSKVSLMRENQGGRLVLSGIDGFPELSVELEFSLCQEKARVEWETHVLNDEQSLSVLSASYPPAPWSAKRANCFIPEHCGWVAENVSDIHFYRDGVYPRGWRFTMSYFAAYTPKRDGGAGFYCGLHDETGAFRTMNAQTDPIEKTGLFFARAHAPGTGKGANAFSLPGKLVWQLFSGDWYDATLLYKEFVHTRAEWLPKVGLEGREDTPLWAKELPVWVMDWMPNTNPLAEPIPTSISKNGKNPPMEYWYEEPLKLQRELGVPIGYHVYNWHWIPFNNDYPYYLPAKKEFEENLRMLQENHVRIMPYTNARLWDTHDREGEDWQFSARARPWATKNAQGRLFTERYESHEPDGSLCELAAMCPSSGVWKEQLAGVLKELFGTLKVDGVYLDQIAAAAPYLCEDPAHNHLPGGGSWWAEQYNLMMCRNRQLRGDNGILTTEDNAEVYAKAMDGFLSWIWTFDNLVPAFSVIYAGYVMMFGRSTNGVKKGDEVFLKYMTAEQLVFGGQLGWLNADIAQRPDELKFFKKMARMRWKYAPFFFKGEALRPAAVECDRPVRITSPAYYDSRLFEAKQLQTGTWRLWDGTRTVLFLINCDTQKAAFTARLRAECATPLEGGGTLDLQRRENGELVLQGTLEQEDYLVLELTGAE